MWSATTAGRVTARTASACLTSEDGRILRSWSSTFAQHKGHRLRVRSEYGDYSDECSEWYDPADPTARLTVVYGDKHKKCSRPCGHEGAHGTAGHEPAHL